MIKDMAKYYKNKTHAVIHISKKLMDELDKHGIVNKGIMVVELDEVTGKITLQQLEKYKGT